MSLKTPLGTERGSTDAFILKQARLGVEVLMQLASVKSTESRTRTFADNSIRKRLHLKLNGFNSCQMLVMLRVLSSVNNVNL